MNNIKLKDITKIVQKQVTNDCEAIVNNIAQKVFDTINQQTKPMSFKRFRTEYYWYIAPEGNIRQSEELFCDLDNYRYSTSNYHETKEQAELAQKKVLLLQKYKDIIREENQGVKFDWKDTTQSKYRIYWNHNRNKWEVTDNYTDCVTDKQLYFLNKSTFDSIRSQMTDEEIRLALGFGGEE